MPRVKRKFKIQVLKEVIVKERPINKRFYKKRYRVYRGYRGEKIIQKAMTDIGPRFRFCYYVYTPSGKRVFGQYAPEYRENDLLKLLEMAIDENMFSKKFLARLKKKLHTGKFMTDQKIVNEITENKNNILSNLKQKDIGTYCFLKKKFAKGDILKDLEFQSKFKQFYIMNSAGLSDGWKERFFELLSAKYDNLKYILSELYKIPRRDGRYSVQFSFATKLLHTVNNENPIYDKMIGEVLDKKINGPNRDEKINSCIEIYNFLKKLYLGLTKNSKIRKVILEFRLRFNVSRKDISDVKALDFIIWSLGKIRQDLKKIQKK